MVIDLRKQKRTIKIELEMSGYQFNLDDIVNKIVGDLNIICEQRESGDKLKVVITLE